MENKMEEIKMEEDKKYFLLVICEDCKYEFGISNALVNHKKEFLVNGQKIFLTYYICPKCGRYHYVQIDNEASLRKLREVSYLFIKLSIAKKKGNVSKKQLAKFNKTRRNLSDYRIMLMKEYTGKLIHDNETDTDFELKFSI